MIFEIPCVWNTTGRKKKKNQRLKQPENSTQRLFSFLYSFWQGLKNLCYLNYTVHSGANLPLCKAKINCLAGVSWKKKLHGLDKTCMEFLFYPVCRQISQYINTYSFEAFIYRQDWIRTVLGEGFLLSGPAATKLAFDLIVSSLEVQVYW